MNTRTTLSIGLGSMAIMLSVPAAHAQMTTSVIQPVLNFDYSRGRNASVNERPRPEYTSTGIPLDSFTIFPTLNLGAGFTDNAYKVDSFKQSSAILTIDPDVRAVSNWSRHSLQFEASGNLHYYTATPANNEQGWKVATAGRLDVGSDSTVGLTASTGQGYDSRFSGSTPANAASSTPYQLTRVVLQGNTTAGRMKFTLTGDYNDSTFGTIKLIDGSTLAQNFRNNQVYELAGRGAYALTPDVSLYGQFQYTKTDYDLRYATGYNDRSSKGYQALAGVSMDLTALLRGSIAAGYINRDYESPLYKAVSGPSFELKLEYFPSELTTVTINGRRVIQDASLSASSGYFNTGGAIRVDHEFLRNLIGNIGVDYEHDNYRGIDSQADIVIASLGARYLVSRSVGIGPSVSYGLRHNSGAVGVGSDFHEASGMITLYLQK